MSLVHFFFIFSLSALVGSINVNGRMACESTPTWEDTYKQQMESSEESARQMGRNGLECETYTSGSGSNSSSNAIIGFFIIFSIVGVFIGICIVCIRRQKAINAANLGQVGAAQVAHGTDLKSYPETNVVQKGDPAYKV